MSVASAMDSAPLEPIKVLFDTDIGSDIDDAVALAYLVLRQDLQLLGITTATGEAAKRAALARQITQQVGLSIPVLPGFEAPLAIPQRQRIAQQAIKLPSTVLQAALKTHNPDLAIDFMAETIRSNPGEVTLLAVGPFTNIARLLSESQASRCSFGKSLLWAVSILIIQPPGAPPSGTPSLTHMLRIRYFDWQSAPFAPLA